MAGRWWLLLILTVAVTLRLTLALVLPFDAAPDERWRYDVTRQIYRTGRAPRWGYDTPHHFVVKPVFGLRFNAFLAHAVPGHLPLGVKLRLGSVVLSVLTVVLAYAAVRNLWPAQPVLAAAVAALVAFLPQAMFVGAYLNHDVYSMFANATVFYLLTRIHRRGGVTPGVAALLGAAFGLVFLGRENGYAGFILGAGYLWYLARQDWPVFRRALLYVLAVFLLFPTAYYLQQFMIYGRAFIPVVTGSGLAWVPPGLSVEEAYQQLPVSGAAYPIVRLDWGDSVHWLLVLIWLFISSFGVFGYMDMMLPFAFYSWYLLLVAVSISGLCRWIFVRAPSRGPNNRSRQWLLGSVTVSIVALVAVVVRHNFLVLFQPQGRYFLPLVVSEMLLLSLGWLHLSRQRDIGVVFVAVSTGFFMLASGYSVWMLASAYV